MSPDLDAMGFGDELDVLRVCKVQAVWRGHSLRKKQWLDAQWMSRRGIRDSRTRFWSTHHGVRAREHGWADQDMHIVEAAADALRMGLPLRDFTKDLEVYSLCFSGCEAVEFLRKWLHENGHPFTHSDAASLCARFLKGRFIASVEITDGAQFAHRFDPGFALYAFTGMASPMLSRARSRTEDESSILGAGASPSTSASTLAIEEDRSSSDDDSAFSSTDTEEEEEEEDGTLRPEPEPEPEYTPTIGDVRAVSYARVAGRKWSQNVIGDLEPEPEPEPEPEMQPEPKRRERSVSGFAAPSSDSDSDSDDELPPPVPAHKLRRKPKPTELREPPPLPRRSTTPPRRVRPLPLAIVQETKHITAAARTPPSPDSATKSILRQSGGGRTPPRARFVSGADAVSVMKEPEPEPEPEPQAKPALPDVATEHLSVRTIGRDKLRDSRGSEFTSYKFGVFIGEELVHELEGRYSILRRKYKTMPKKLLGCTAQFPGKRVEQSFSLDENAREEELRAFFASLLVPTGEYDRTGHARAVQKLHDAMNVRKEASERLIVAEFEELPSMDSDSDEDEAVLPEGACREDDRTIDVIKKLDLRLRGERVATVRLRCIFEFENDECAKDASKVGFPDNSSRRGERGDEYEAREAKQILSRFGALNVVEKWNTKYERDPCLEAEPERGIVGGTSFNAPPCRRVYHVYGTNLETEITYAYKRLNGVEVTAAGPKSCSIALDASLDKKFRDRNYVCKGGIVYETRNTDQSPALGHQHDRVHASGDGTCPYISMHHSLTWHGEDVSGGRQDEPRVMHSEIVELPGVEHRDILADRGFHERAGEYLCETLVVYVVEARHLRIMDKFARSSDPWCEVKLHFNDGGRRAPRVAASQRTKTHTRNLNPDFEEAFVFGVSESLEHADFISLEVFDADAGGLRNEHIGVVEIRLDDINRAQDEDGKPTRAVHGWFRLQNRPGYPSDTAGSSGGRRRSSDDCGEIFVHCELESSGQSFRGMGSAAAFQKIKSHHREKSKQETVDQAQSSDRRRSPRRASRGSSER